MPVGHDAPLEVPFTANEESAFLSFGLPHAGHLSEPVSVPDVNNSLVCPHSSHVNVNKGMLNPPDS